MGHKISTMNDWLEISRLLLQDVIPAHHPDERLKYFGVGMSPQDFAALIRRESPLVDHALVAMATASDEHEVRTIVKQIKRETLIALFSRWAQYTEQWKSLPAGAAHWIPSDPNDIWRAVLLSMSSDSPHSKAAAQTLWPEVFGVPPGST